VTYLAIYWIIAGLASFRLDGALDISFVPRLITSLMFGGIAIPVRILAKLAA
jgi:hypothetical protein